LECLNLTFQHLNKLSLHEFFGTTFANTKVPATWSVTHGNTLSTTRAGNATGASPTLAASLCHWYLRKTMLLNESFTLLHHIPVL